MTAVTHPAWCDTSECDAEPGHLHYSRAINVPADPANPDSARFILVVYGDADSRPLLDLGILPTTARNLPRPVVEVDAPQLLQLHAALGAVLHVLTADDPAATELPDLNAPEGGATS